MTRSITLALRSTLLSALFCLVSCSGAKDTYHVGRHGWSADSISFQLYPTGDSLAHPSLPDMTVTCLSCNLVNPPVGVHFDPTGYTSVFIPETIHALSARLRVEGSGLDTTFIQKQRSPSEASKYFKVERPLIGRVLVTQLALLYSDSTQDTVVTNAQIGDELNIFGEHPPFYMVHHPLFPHPLYMLKSQAVRLF